MVRLLVQLVAFTILTFLLLGCGKSARTAEEQARHDREVADERAANAARNEEYDRKQFEEKAIADRTAAEKLKVETDARAKRDAEVAKGKDAIAKAYAAAEKLPKVPSLPLPTLPTKLVGKAVVIEDGVVCEWNLPEKLAGRLTEPETVFFFVIKTERKVAGYQVASGKGILGDTSTELDKFAEVVYAYQVEMDIRIVLPNGTALGPFRVSGGRPPASVSLAKNEYGFYATHKSASYTVRSVSGALTPEYVEGYFAKLSGWIEERFSTAVPAFEQMLAESDETACVAKVQALKDAIGTDAGKIEYAAEKLRTAKSSTLQYALVTLLRESTKTRNLGATFREGEYRYATGPESPAEFDTDPKGWVQRWLDWAAKR